MYISQINSTTNFGCAKMLEKAPQLLEISLLKNKNPRICLNKKVDRNLLQKNSLLPILHYDDYFNDVHVSDMSDDEYFQPSKDKEAQAKDVVIKATMTNAFTGAAFAQFPGLDEIGLGAADAAMALRIIRGIYGFKFDDTIIKTILLTVRTNVTRKVVSKTVTWIPLWGNVVNAVTAGYTTKTFGYALVDECERIRKEIERNKKIDDILNGE